jgi:bifunctional non-homologous end joining protein LigD
MRFDAMKAVLVDRAFSDPDWIFERKLDGVRCGAFRERGRVTLLSRNNLDLGGRYPEIVEALSVPGPDVVLDGEVVAFKGGQTSFERLQQRGRRRVAIFYYLFDILSLDGRDVTAEPLRARKRLLREAVDFRGPLRFTTHRNADGETAFRHACESGWEGVIAKRADSPYRATRSRDWLKIKCDREQELVVGGWTAPKGSRVRLGALLVGYYDGGRLRYAGKVGTGFDRVTLEMLGDELEKREVDGPPFDGGKLPRDARWARPELVAQIGFTEWTRDGRLRHPRYLGLRDDKAAREVVREEPS